MAFRRLTSGDSVHRQGAFKEVLNVMLAELYSLVAGLTSSLGSLTTTVGGLTTSVNELATVKHTPIGGIAVQMVNGTGAPTVKGYLVTPSSSANFAVSLTAVDVPNCIGVFLDSGVADGQPAWVVISGIADVYFSGSSTRGHMARIGVASDTGEQAGQAISEAVPTSPFATDKHFGEIGHVAESRTGAGLARVVLHFN